MQTKPSASDLIDGAKNLLERLTPHQLVIGVAVVLTLVSWVWPSSSFFTSLALLVSLALYVWCVQKATRILKDLVPVDFDTKLFDRQEGLRRLGTESTRAVEAGRPLAVLIVDLTLNSGARWSEPDTRERQRILLTAAKLLRQQIRSYDCAVRTGEATFLVVVPEAAISGTEARVTKLASEVRLTSMEGEPVCFAVRTDTLGQNEDAATFFTRVEGLLDCTTNQASTP